MKDKVRKALKKVLKEFLDTSKSRVNMSEISESDMVAFEKAMTYAASFVQSKEEKLAAESIELEYSEDLQSSSLADLFFE